MIVPNRCLVRMSIVRLCNYVIIFVYWSVDFASLKCICGGAVSSQKKEKEEEKEKKGKKIEK